MTDKEHSKLWIGILVLVFLSGFFSGIITHVHLNLDAFREMQDFKDMIWMLEHGNFTDGVIWFEFDGYWWELRRHD